MFFVSDHSNRFVAAFGALVLSAVMFATAIIPATTNVAVFA